MPEYKKMCTELVEKLDELNCHYNVPNQSAMIERALAALAEPEPEGPTDEELLKLANEWDSGYESIEFEFIADYARAVLARWGK